MVDTGQQVGYPTAHYNLTGHSGNWTRARCECYLVIAPQPGQAIGVHDAEDFALCILPADVVFVPAVRQELIDIVPQQPAV